MKDAGQIAWRRPNSRRHLLVPHSDPPFQGWVQYRPPDELINAWMAQ